MRLGLFLKEKREILGLSKEGLAKKAGVTSAMIRSIESGRTNGLMLETAIKLSKVLNVSVAEMAAVLEKWEAETRIKGR